MNNLKSQLKAHIQSNNLDRFFDELDFHLAPDSELADLVLLLKNRFHRLKMDIIRGIISKEQEQLQENVLVNNILDILQMSNEDDFKKEEVHKSIAYFHSTISAKHKELETITNKKADGIEKAGQSLIKLGKLLSGNRDELDPAIPFHELLQSASGKADRRVRIGCKELKEVRLFQNKTFRELIDLYRALVLYMDVPEEDIDAGKITMLTQMLSDVKRYNSNLKKVKGRTTNYLSDSVQELNQLLNLETILLQALPLEQEEVKDIRESIHNAFRYFEAIKLTYSETLDFFTSDGVQIDQLIEECNGLVGELELNVKEY